MSTRLIVLRVRLIGAYVLKRKEQLVGVKVTIKTVFVQYIFYIFLYIFFGGRVMFFFFFFFLIYFLFHCSLRKFPVILSLAFFFFFFFRSGLMGVGGGILS